MSTVYFYTIYDQTSKRPRCAGIRINDKVTTYELFRSGHKKPLRSIYNTINKIRDFIVASNDRGHTIVTSDFKQALITYQLPIDSREYNVYDVHLSGFPKSITAANDPEKDVSFIHMVLDKMVHGSRYEYQKLISNAAVVYQDLENRGLYVNETLFHPHWSMHTFSGRSKTTGFNIQGLEEDNIVKTTDSMVDDVLLHFDWIAADIRVASLLSGDSALMDSFNATDPYTEMVRFFTSDGGSNTRDECKIYLLKTINSMDIDNDALAAIFPSLGDWIKRCYNTTRNPNGVLETLLQRRFRVSRAKNALAAFNGAMQGSVAHAMHAVLRRIWERVGSYLIAEVHDSIIMAVPNDLAIIRSMIDIVVPIMTHPFSGLLEEDHFFPVRVSVGKKWKKWKLLETHRLSGVERVSKKRETASSISVESQKEGTTAEASEACSGATEDAET